MLYGIMKHNIKPLFEGDPYLRKGEKYRIIKTENDNNNFLVDCGHIFNWWLTSDQINVIYNH